MKKYLTKTKTYILKHKIISIIVLIAILLFGYWGYKKLTSTAGDTRYLTAKVERGTIVSSVSGSGQVSSLNQVDIKAKVSGDISYLPVVDGQKIEAGALLAKLDDRDAQKSIRDAEVNLESVKISLDKLKIQKSSENMNADLAKAYDDGFNTVSNTFLELPGIMTGLNDIFFKSTINTSQWNIDWYEGQVATTDREKAVLFKKKFNDSYDTANNAYKKTLDNYKTVSRTASGEVIEALIIDTYDTTKLISDSVKNANNYVDFVVDSIGNMDHNTPAIITTHKASLSTYTSEANSSLLNLLNIKTSIKSYKDAFLNSDLDIQSAELSVKQKENTLQDLKDNLADYYIRAPFAGTITVVHVKKGDAVGSSTAVATLITTKQIAEISLNEVDVAKIKIGQKATLTFDAIPNLSISGAVADIETVGTVSQGVVTYIVKISFDTQDERVKSGMSVNAAIVTDIKQDVLVVPNSAVKSQGGASYVEMFDAPLSPSTDGLIGTISLTAPKKITVEVGLANDSESEIVSGIQEGAEIVTRTILPSATPTSTAAPSIFSSPATGNRGGGNAVRIPTGR